MALAVGSPLKQWADSVLQLTGLPVTPTNEDTLFRWARAESGSNPLRWNNPLNTEESWPGAVSVNSVGVKSYPDINTGARATAATLTNGYYPDILAALQNSLPTTQWGSAARAQVTKWGTNLAFLGGSGGGSVYSSSSTSGSSYVYGANPRQIGYTSGPPGQGQDVSFPNPFDALTNAITGAGANIGTGISGAEQSFTKKLIAVLEIGAGGAMLLASAVILVILVSRTEGGRAVTGAAGKATRAVGNLTPQGRAVSVASAAKPKAPLSPEAQASVAKPKAPLSPEAQASVAAAKAGRGSRLSPRVREELRGRAA